MLSRARARRIWLRAQRLDEPAPFGAGPAATRAAVEHLGYVQIDTINVIERCHHQILYTRIPDYRREDLHQAQTMDKTVFEYWTHALSYVPTRDMRFFVPAMKRFLRKWSVWSVRVTPEDFRRVTTRIRKQGALTIRDIDEVLVEKAHAWSSRKPSKQALQLAFYRGLLTISERTGMLKTYELTTRHFGWDRMPPAATETEILDYMLDRALRSQGVVSLESTCYLDAGRKPGMRRRIEARVRRGELVPVELEGAGKQQHWAMPRTLEERIEPVPEERAHILSPFDPLMRERKRTHLLFGYEHRFEAYVPKAKRVLGYFVQPVLVGEEIAAAIDLKTDRESGKLLVQKWNWIGKGARRARRARIEEALHRFERFQLASDGSNALTVRSRTEGKARIR